MNGLVSWLTHRQAFIRTCSLEHHSVSSTESDHHLESFLCRFQAVDFHNPNGFHLSRSLLTI